MKIDENIVCVTEEDVRVEAVKMARDQATVKHDSIYGRKHGLEAPEIHMVSGVSRSSGPPPRRRERRKASPSGGSARER